MTQKTVHHHRAVSAPRPGALARRAGVALGLALLLVAGQFAAGAPARAVESEEFTQTQGNRHKPGNTPSEWFVFVKPGETLRVQAGTHVGKDAIDRADLPEGEVFESPEAEVDYLMNGRRAFFTVTGPDGALVATNDNDVSGPTPLRERGTSMLDPDDLQPQAVTIPAGGEGIYRVVLRNSNKDAAQLAFPWRITVRDAGGAELPGRAWVETYRMVEQWKPATSAQEREGLDLDYWFVSEQGYQYELTMNGFVGWTSIISASLLGNTDEQCVSQYHSYDNMAQIGIPCEDLYNLFFEEPAADLPATAPVAAADASTTNPSVATTSMWVMPPVEAPTVTLDGFAPAGSGAPKAGVLSYSFENFAGNYTILIDADGDGSTDGPLDRQIPRSLTRGSEALGVAAPQSFDFDGLDATGAEIPASVAVGATIRVTQFPELHFVFGDIEQLKNGLSLTRKPAPGTGDPADELVYWNDSMPATTEGGEPTLLGEQACGTPKPGRDDANNPIVNTGGLPNRGELPGLRFWDTVNENGWGFQACRDQNSSVTGSYGNEKLLDTWTYAKTDLAATFTILGESLRAGKTATPERVLAGGTVSYTVTLTNNGTEPLSAAGGTPAVLKDELAGVLGSGEIVPGSLAATVGGAPAPAPTLSGTVLSWVGDLGRGEVATISYDVAIGDEPAATLTNRAAALRAESDPVPDAEACAALATTQSYNCASVSTAASLPGGPTAKDEQKRVAPGASVTFDPLGSLVTAGDSAELTVTLLDPATGTPTTKTSVAVAGGTWTIDPATGTISFAATAGSVGMPGPIGYRVTDGNGLTAEATLSATLILAGDPGTTPGTPGQGMAETGADSPQLWLLLAGLLVAGGATLTARRALRRR